MFGAVLKEEARMKKDEDSRKTVVVSIMPCTAKKEEIHRPEHFTDGEQDVDFVLTTAEIAEMIKAAGIDLTNLTPEALDMPFGMASGAGAIFGATGGVTEAVLRYLTGSTKAEDIEAIHFTGISGRGRHQRGDSKSGRQGRKDRRCQRFDQCIKADRRFGSRKRQLRLRRGYDLQERLRQWRRTASPREAGDQVQQTERIIPF